MNNPVPGAKHLKCQAHPIASLSPQLGGGKDENQKAKNSQKHLDSYRVLSYQMLKLTLTFMTNPQRI
jgi:hypothetical protein